MVDCECRDLHDSKRIVLTGGPGAGKTAVLELVRQHFCRHVHVLGEAASVVFGGGFPRRDTINARRAAQRAIFHVQHELESCAADEGAAIVLCDRGTIDGAAYWPGEETLWSNVGTTLAEELARYDAVIHLKTPASANGYNHQNPLRVETAAEAARIDAAIFTAWDLHPRRFLVEPTTDFLSKARTALDIVRSELPECCRQHVVPLVDGSVKVRSAVT